MGNVEFVRFFEKTMIQKKVVYTAVFGNYDQVSAVNESWDCDFICFTDNPNLVSHGWKVVEIPLNGESPAQVNRRYKLLPHKYFPNHEHSLYLDGNVKIVEDPSHLFEKYLDKGVIAIPRHPFRNCAYLEARLCIKSMLANKEVTENQMKRYAAEGFPKNFGLTANRVLLRKHHDASVIVLMESWWDEYCMGGNRDQLSLSYLIWRYKINVLELLESPGFGNHCFEIIPHKVDKSKSVVERLTSRVNRKMYLAYYYRIIADALLRFSRLNNKIEK